MRTTFRGILVAILLVACEELPTGTAPVTPPSMRIEDAVHNEGNAHFFFLPPLVPQPTPSGVFDAALAPTVEICALDGASCTEPLVAEYTMTTGPGSETIRLDAENEHYIVNWHTDQFDLSAEVTYRIRVLAGGTELGLADVDVVNGGAELRNVNTNEYIPLKDGRTLPIKFRIEEGAVFVVGSAGGTFSSTDGRVTAIVPSGALSEPVGITVRLTSEYPGAIGLIGGAVYEFSPDGLEFVQPVAVVITYDEASLPAGLPEAELVLLTETLGIWDDAAGANVDTGANTVTGFISGFSKKGAGQRVATVEVTPGAVTLEIGETIGLIATPKNALGEILDRNVTWSSTNAGVASVDGNGLVTAVGAGSVEMGAASGSATGTALVTVGSVISPCQAAYDSEVSACDLDNDPSVCGGDPFCEEDILALRARCRAGAEERRQQCEGCDADQIAFTASRDGNEEIYLMNADGSGVTNLTNDAGFDWGPVWSPSAPTIAFRSDRTGNCDVFTLNVYTMVLTNVTNRLGCDQNPAWSPDGTRIAFQAGTGTSAEIWVMNADGTSKVNVSNTSGADFEPVWSPDGTKLAFQSTRDGNTEIYVVNANGTGQANLTNNPGGDFSPQWSPDGTRIAFDSDRGGVGREIYIMNANGTLQNLVRSGFGIKPVWSPDGARIVFEAGDVYAMGVGSGGIVNLAPAPGQDRSPSWSRDGTRIVFDSQQDGGSPEIYVVNPNGTGLTRLTFATGSDQAARWQLYP